MKTFDEVYETLPGTGWLSRDEAELLYRIASETTGQILEVGCYHGRSTCLLGAFGRPMLAFDKFAGFSDEDPSGDKTLAAFLDNLKTRDLYNVVLVKVDFANWQVPAQSWYFGPVGLAYLDGDHSYSGTIIQIEKAIQAGAEVIAIHDVNDSGGGAMVKDAAISMLGCWDERVDRLAVWKRNKK